MSYRRYRGFSLSPILILIIVNFLLFIATIIAGKEIYYIQGFSILAYKAHYYLGLLPIAFWERPWTIVTSMFLHAGFGHIFANMFTLYFFGSAVARLIGKGRFLIVYFGGGILGNILLLLLAPFFPFSIAIGASGAVFALGGTLAVMRPGLRVIVFPIPAPIPLWIAVIGGFVILSFLPLVAWQAHLGGLIFGLILGYVFRKRERYIYY